MFVFVCELDSKTPDSEFRNIIFKVITKTHIVERFDTYHFLWENFGFRNEKLKKKLGYYEIESIENPCQITVVINPKEYRKQYEDLKTKKKHKGVKKNIYWNGIRKFCK